MKYRDIFGYLIEYFLGCNVPNSYTRNHQHDSGIQENYNTPLEHTPGNPPGQLWKESHYSLLVKV